ncbi:MAG: KamA family radical SAM protein [Planctomycetota bacterium]|nr:KamA family radical SAM protein [Planctomycetota bacterium]
MEDWLRLLGESVSSAEELERELPDVDGSAVAEVIAKFPMRINPYFLGVAKAAGPHLLRQIVPDPRELSDDCCVPDPLSEEAQSPVPNLTHRYPDRCLFLVAHQCATYCRFCTRKRKVGNADVVTPETIELGLGYIREHAEIRDVIVSGGDPLLLQDDVLEDVVARLRAIPHVEIIRIGTRVPCTLPQRVTSRLVRLLKRHQPIYVNLHFNHADELTEEAREACLRLADAGFPLGSQTVLLRGVNDSPEAIKDLFHGLLQVRVRPYYLYQADVTSGTNHFRTPVRKGLDIIKSLRGFTSGLAVPHFVIDTPGGGGKVPMTPRYVVRHSANEVVMRNYSGAIFKYPEVSAKDASAPVTVPVPAGVEQQNGNGDCPTGNGN